MKTIRYKGELYRRVDGEPVTAKQIDDALGKFESECYSVYRSGIILKSVLAFLKEDAGLEPAKANHISELIDELFKVEKAVSYAMKDHASSLLAKHH